MLFLHSFKTRIKDVIICGTWAFKQKPFIVQFWPPGEVHKFFCLFSGGSDELLQGAAGTPLALLRCQDPHTYLEGGGDTASLWKDVSVLDTIPGFDMGAKFCDDLKLPSMHSVPNYTSWALPLSPSSANLI